MSLESLRTLWFVLIAVLWVGFFFLEGFDFGVGMLLPFLGRKDDERRLIINSIGPHWDGNEVWLLTAGGATFAAFPQWYATLFSGFYIPLFLLLLALIVRGVAFEFRSKDRNPRWRSLWDWCIFAGSLLPSLLLGVTFANLVVGVPINDKMTFTGDLFTLLNPFGLLGGLTLVAVFLFHGINFLNRKLSGDLLERSRKWTLRLWLTAFVFESGWGIATLLITTAQARLKGLSIAMLLLGMLFLLAAGMLVEKKRDGWAFITTGVSVLLIPVSYFTILFPRLMVSSTGPEFSLTITNASSSAYTLSVMNIVALVFLPFVLAYQAWSYWVFRKRMGSDTTKLTY